MKIQSAGRLGNILFIWAFALKQREKLELDKVIIFADKFHTNINNDLLDTFSKLDDGSVKFTIDNRLGFLLKLLDKLAALGPRTSKFIQKGLRIQNEGERQLRSNPWIHRGYFQEPKFLSEIDEQIYDKLVKVLKLHESENKLKDKFPYLKNSYQAIHIRLTDYVGSEFGVVSPVSQIQCLDKNLKVVICTDGTLEEIASRIDISNIEVVTAKDSSAWETLAILSGAENLVTTNSTLSWWSGFLAINNGKKVWAPLYWNSNHSIQRNLPSGSENTYLPIFE